MGRNPGYSGSVKIGDRKLKDIKEDSLMKNITYISRQSYLFKGAIELLMWRARMTSWGDLCPGREKDGDSVPVYRLFPSLTGASCASRLPDGGAFRSTGYLEGRRRNRHEVLRGFRKLKRLRDSLRGLSLYSISRPSLQPSS